MNLSCESCVAVISSDLSDDHPSVSLMVAGVSVTRLTNLMSFTSLSGWNVLCEAPTNASSSTRCAPPACSAALASPEPDTPPQGGAWGAIPQTEAAAGRLPEITRVMEATLIINIITGTAAETEIRSWIETKTDATEATENGDALIDRAETKTRTHTQTPRVKIAQLCVCVDLNLRGSADFAQNELHETLSSCYTGL